MYVVNTGKKHPPAKRNKASNWYEELTHHCYITCPDLVKVHALQASVSQKNKGTKRWSTVSHANEDGTFDVFFTDNHLNSNQSA
jgi:hypothetical protein